MLIQPNLGVWEIHKGMNKRQVTALLGRPGSIDGSIWCYDSLGLGVLFRDGDEGTMVNIHCRELFRGATEEGIGIGSSREELIKAFG